MKDSLVWILIAFAIYLVAMIIVGIVCAKKNNDAADYFLGGRQLGGFVAALSAQASDMSGWLLMGLPGSIYAFGTGQIWIAVGLFIGTVCNWLFISKRLRRYTIRANNSLTLPAFFENRFHDKSRVLLLSSSIVIVIFFLVYTASALSAGGKLFSTVLGIDYTVALSIGAGVILVYTFFGGFFAVCATDFIQGMLMLVGLISVPIIAYILIGGDVAANIAVQEGTANFLNPVINASGETSVIDIVSQLAWGLGYMGMPHILVRFMAVRDEKELTKSKVVAITWVAISLFAACIIGIIGRAYLPAIDDTEKVFIEMIEKIFVSEFNIPIIGGIFLCGILAAIMSTADSQLLVSASSVSSDIYKSVLKKDADDKKVLMVSRITVIVIAILAFLIALDPSNSIMDLVSDAWAGLGSAFGPLVICSLFWKRTNLPGAFLGIITGALTVIIWDYVPLVNGETIYVVTGVYSLLVGFFLSLAAIVIVSLCTKAPSEEILQEFEDAKNGNI